MDVEAASQESDDFLLSLTDVHFVDGDVRVYGQDVGESLLQLHQQLTGNVGESFRFHGSVILMWPHDIWSHKTVGSHAHFSVDLW